MSSFIIEGGHQLKGSIRPQGAKNEALQVICATLLTPGPVTIHNIPNIRDVIALIHLLEGLGVQVTNHQEGSFTFQAGNINLDHLKTTEYQNQATGLRGSVMLLGPLLARFGKAFIPNPGGDKIGRRRMDTHFNGLAALGAEFTFDPVAKSYTIQAKNLKGSSMLLEEASVTGTANVIMAAVLSTGTTTIFNAACEPYVVQLCRMLNRMGAQIEGIGSNLLTIHGVDSLHGTSHTLQSDMIEVGSFIGLAAMTRSELFIQDVNQTDLGIIPQVFQRLGIKMEFRDNGLWIPAQEEYTIETFMDGSILTVADAPWPGFTPDLISIVLVVATQAKGSVLIHQKMFESRLYFVDKLIDMGAQIILCDPHRAAIIGLNRQHPLRGIRMASPDIRAGVALLIAALTAQGQSIIDNIDQIDRGYQFIDRRLNSLGANIIRTE